MDFFTLDDLYDHGQHFVVCENCLSTFQGYHVIERYDEFDQDRSCETCGMEPRATRPDPHPPTGKDLTGTRGLKPIMFWTDQFTPQHFADQNGMVPRTRVKKAIALLQSGRAINHYRGLAQCRICKQLLGSRDFSDGIYVWPEKAEHYIEDHGFWHPYLDGFIDTKRTTVEPKVVHTHRYKGAAPRH